MDAMDRLKKALVAHHRKGRGGKKKSKSSGRKAGRKSGKKRKAASDPVLAELARMNSRIDRLAERPAPRTVVMGPGTAPAKARRRPKGRKSSRAKGPKRSGKKYRSPAQIAATKRMLAARKKKLG